MSEYSIGYDNLIAGMVAPLVTVSVIVKIWIWSHEAGNGSWID